ASVSTGLVDNPKRTVPMATMLGTALAGIIYIAATQAISGMFPASELAKSGAPFGMAASLMVGSWANSVVSLFTALACLTSLGSWMMLVGQAGARAASDGNFPAVYGEMSASGIPRKGLILASIKMTVLMIMVAFLGSQGGSAASLFTQITSIAVLLTMLPYFYSCINLIRMEGANAKNMLSMLAGILGSAFCFVALAGAEQAPLAGTFIVSLIILIFYTRKIAKRGAAGQTQS
ncbi:MAG: amino acid permease, partial [Plesiomonas sp.]